jgi:hypothetical protein
MLLSHIVLQIRNKDTVFGERVGGAADLEIALNQPADVVLPETAFVVQLAEVASPNQQDNHIQQIITETFAVIIVLKNDTTQSDKTGITAYDRLFAIRAEIFSAILGWFMPGAEKPISYVGARSAGIDRSNLWHQFEFAVETLVTMEDAVDSNVEDMLDTIRAQYVQAGSELNNPLPWPSGRIPILSTDTDAEQEISFT